MPPALSKKLCIPGKSQKNVVEVFRLRAGQRWSLGTSKPPVLLVPVIFSQRLNGHGEKQTFRFIKWQSEEWTDLCGRINSTKSPASGSYNDSETRLISQVGRVREIVCA